MRSAVTDAEVRNFYTKNGWQPVWSKAAAQALSTVLADRRRHALDRLDFEVEEKSGGAAARREAARTKAALRYASALAQGSVDPASLHNVYTIPRPHANLAAGLVQAISNDRLAAWFHGLAPQDDEYRKLSDAYVRFSEKASDASDEQIARSGLIRAGDSDPRVPAILDELRSRGYLPGKSDDRARVTSYDEAAAEAIKQLQRDFGIADDGVVGPNTLRVLNLGPGDRARALAVALERRRWLSRSPEPTRIDINVAAARLAYFRDGKMVDSRKVVVGQPDNETPSLQSPIYRLVANPTWTVPKSIQNGELSNVGSGYLEAHNMVRQDGWIVQQPGPNNALGLVKFDMQNKYAIYLHDTSSPALFERSDRHLSHGCVRVEEALDFARRLAEDEGISDKWQEAQQSDQEIFVPLPRQIPVRLLYLNVFVDNDGALAFRTDPYGRNNAVAQALGFERRTQKQQRTEDVKEIGP